MSYKPLSNSALKTRLRFHFVLAAFILMIVSVSGCDSHPDAGEPRFFAPVMAQIEVDHPWYWRPMVSNERYGIYIENSLDNIHDLLDYPPLALWVTQEVGRKVAAIPLITDGPKGYKEYINNVSEIREGERLEYLKKLDHFIAEGKKTKFEVDKIAPIYGDFLSMSDVNNYGLSTRLINGQLTENTHRFFGGDAILIPNQTVKKTSFSAKGRKQYLYRGKPIIEQDWNKVDAIFGQKDFVVYDGDYVVFWDYPYYKRNAAGKPTWRWYVVKVPKDDPTWFDPEWVKGELVRVGKRIEIEKLDDYNGDFRDGKPKWKETLRYLEELQGLGKEKVTSKAAAKESK